jgi:hypothetical protein
MVGGTKPATDFWNPGNAELQLGIMSLLIKPQIQGSHRRLVFSILHLSIGRIMLGRIMGLEQTI